MQRKTVDEDEELDSDHEEEIDEASSSAIDSNDHDDIDDAGSPPSSARRGTRKRKKFVIPPPRALPQRTTRGKRMGALSIPDDDDADEEFWNQEFFAEEERDDRYETESEPEDRFDEDFMDSEEEEEEEGEEEDRVLAMEPKRKVLKPPGYKKKPVTASSKATKPIKQEQQIHVIPERTMSVRKTTRQKVEKAEEQRKFQEEIKPKKVTKSVVHRQLTQAELLAEAARTEVENIRSLQYMEAIEEENKRKATSNGGRYSGPMISVKSVKNSDGLEQTAVVVKNMAMPEYLRPQKAPPAPEKDMCVVTNTVAKYRDPLTGKPYATLEAFKVLRGMHEST